MSSELTALLPSLYALLPLPAASSAIEETLSESIFKFGKGTKVLTEPLIAWSISPAGQNLVDNAEGGEAYTKRGRPILISEPSDEMIGFAKLVAALVEHSSEWIISRIKQHDVQAFLNLCLRLTGWAGSGGVDETVSEVSRV